MRTDPRSLGCLAACAALLAGGCGGPARPAPTARAVSPADLVGVWRLDLTNPKAEVTLYLRPDGTYSQTITQPRTPLRFSPGGTWTVRGPKVTLTDYASVSALNTGAITWDVIDRPGGDLTLFGGDFQDPDSFRPLTRVGNLPPDQQQDVGGR